MKIIFNKTKKHTRRRLETLSLQYSSLSLATGWNNIPENDSAESSERVRVRGWKRSALKTSSYEILNFISLRIVCIKALSSSKMLNSSGDKFVEIFSL
jgi:hypothetical protein